MKLQIIISYVITNLHDPQHKKMKNISWISNNWKYKKTNIKTSLISLFLPLFFTNQTVFDTNSYSLLSLRHQPQHPPPPLKKKKKKNETRSEESERNTTPVPLLSFRAHSLQYLQADWLVPPPTWAGESVTTITTTTIIIIITTATLWLWSQISSLSLRQLPPLTPTHLNSPRGRTETIFVQTQLTSSCLKCTFPLFFPLVCSFLTVIFSGGCYYYYYYYIIIIIIIM